MPLSYDDNPGSWGTYSVSWPKIIFNTEREVDRAFVACSREDVVPYGSYVKVGLEIRLETEKMKRKLLKHLDKSPYTTAEQVLASLTLY